MSLKSLYRIDDIGVHHVHGDHEHSMPWDSMQGLKQSLFSKKNYLAGSGMKFPLEGTAEESASWIESFYQQWKLKNPEAAKKNAFDYSFPNKTFAGALLVTCLLIALPFGGALLKDSWDQTHCTEQLSRGAESTVANITKAKKKRKGHYLLSISFTAKDGTEVSGHDQFITEDASNPPSTMPVVYATENPKCWTTPTSVNKEEVNWAKRRYFSAFTLLFGLFCFVGGLLGLVFSITRLREKRAHQELVRKLFALR